ANDAEREVDFRHDRDLAPMRFKIGILDERARTDTAAIDYETERAVDVFKFCQAPVWVDLAACVAETSCEVIEINRCVHERNIQRETGRECRGDFRAESSRAKWQRPFWNFNFAG